MFSFFKKEKKSTETPAVPLTAEESQEAEALIANLESQLQAETDIDEQAKLYEALGLAQAKLSRTEEAIDALEKSLQAKKSIGDGYKKTDVPLQCSACRRRTKRRRCKDRLLHGQNGRNAANRQTTYDQRQLN